MVPFPFAICGATQRGQFDCSWRSKSVAGGWVPLPPKWEAEEGSHLQMHEAKPIEQGSPAANSLYLATVQRSVPEQRNAWWPLKRRRTSGRSSRGRGFRWPTTTPSVFSKCHVVLFFPVNHLFFLRCPVKGTSRGKPHILGAPYFDALTCAKGDVLAESALVQTKQVRWPDFTATYFVCLFVLMLNDSWRIKSGWALQMSALKTGGLRISSLPTNVKRVPERSTNPYDWFASGLL